jgi:two-component system C4-dicarboxylate transport response regulator DctD
MSVTVRRRLLDHDWPGNVRELAHFAERVLAGLEAPQSATPSPTSDGLAESLARYESQLIIESLESCGGDVVAVARTLKLPRKTLYDKLQRHGLRPADFRNRN